MYLAFVVHNNEFIMCFGCHTYRVYILVLTILAIQHINIGNVLKNKAYFLFLLCTLVSSLLYFGNEEGM